VQLSDDDTPGARTIRFTTTFNKGGDSTASFVAIPDLTFNGEPVSANFAKAALRSVVLPASNTLQFQIK